MQVDAGVDKMRHSCANLILSVQDNVYTGADGAAVISVRDAHA